MIALQILVHRYPIQIQKLRIPRAEIHGDRKRFPAIVAAPVPVTEHQILKSIVLVQIASRGADQRKKSFLPASMEIKTFLGIKAKILLPIDGRPCARVAFNNPQLFQKFNNRL